MSTRLVHVGFSGYLSVDKIITIAVPNSAPIKRMVLEARTDGRVIDLTGGRRVKAVIFTDSKHIILVALEPVTITGRLQDSV